MTDMYKDLKVALEGLEMKALEGLDKEKNVSQFLQKAASYCNVVLSGNPKDDTIALCKYWDIPTTEVTVLPPAAPTAAAPLKDPARGEKAPAPPPATPPPHRRPQRRCRC